MGTGQVIVGGEKSPSAARPAPKRALEVVAAFCLVFLAAGLIDLALTLGPAELRTTDVRFTALASAGSSLPLVSVGVLGFLAASLALGSRARVALATVGSALLFLAAFVSLFLLLGARAETLAAAPDNLRTLVTSTATRAASAFGLFGLAGGVGGWFGVRWLRGGGET